MERFEADTFAAFEADISQDITSSLTHVDELFVEGCERLLHIPGEAYDDLRADQLREEDVRRVAEVFFQVAEELWQDVRDIPYEQLPHLDDHVTVSLAAGTAYVSLGSGDAMDMLQLEAGQSISGTFAGLAISDFIPEGIMVPPLQSDEMVDQRLVHPLGFHMILRNTAVHVGDIDAEQPDPADEIYIPLHHRALFASMLKRPDQE